MLFLTRIIHCSKTVEQAFEILSGDSEYKQLLKKTLVGIEAAVRDNDTEKVFYYPVTDNIAPGYSSVIKEPMCLSLIREKVLNCKYRDLEGFKNDVRLFVPSLNMNQGTHVMWFMFLCFLMCAGGIDVCKLHQVQ